MRSWQRLQLHPGIRRFLFLFVRLTDGWIWMILAVLLALFLPADRFFDLLIQGLIAGAVTLPSYWGLKSFFRRTRPHNMFKRIVPGVSPRDLYSFPSGHTMNNLAVGVSLAFHVPMLWPIALLLPVIVGLLRVLFGVHFILDVVAGFLFGLPAGLIAVGLHALLHR